MPDHQPAAKRFMGSVAGSLNAALAGWPGFGAWPAIMSGWRRPSRA